MSLIHTEMAIIQNGQIVYRQPYGDYNTRPSLEMISCRHSSDLLKILSDLNYINYNRESHSVVAKKVLTGNNEEDALRILGGIAEALIVNLCNNDIYYNRMFSNAARHGCIETGNLDNHIAIATGHHKTKIHYRKLYNPSDTQRDIVWSMKDENLTPLLSIKHPNFQAGLQIKVSTNGMRYVVPDIEHYYCPIIYFPIKNDFHKVQRAIYDKHPNSIIYHPDAFSRGLLDDLINYYDLILAYVENRLSLTQMLSHSRQMGGEHLLKIGMAGADKNLSDGGIILDTHL